MRSARKDHTGSKPQRRLAPLPTARRTTGVVIVLLAYSVVITESRTATSAIRPERLDGTRSSVFGRKERRTNSNYNALPRLNESSNIVQQQGERDVLQIKSSPEAIASSGRTYLTPTTMVSAPGSVSRAEAVVKDQTSSRGLPSFKIMLLVLMVLQNSLSVLVGKYTRSSGVSNKEDLYVVSHVILACEGMKFLLSCILEYYATDGKLVQSFKENVVHHPMEFVRILIPSLLYLVQNSILYVALSNLSAPLFQVTYQCKLVTSALVSVIMLQRSYSLKQWVCMTTLGLGVAIVVLGENIHNRKGDIAAAVSGKASGNMIAGLTAVAIASLSSALAGVSLEKTLKKSNDDGSKSRPSPSLWMRNMQMAFFSLLIAAIQMWTSYGDEATKPFMHGFNFWVYLLVLLQAGGGLLVAAVIKYADNVLKGLATGVSVVVATCGSMALFGTPLTKQFTLGASIILSSVYLFSNEFPRASKFLKDRDNRNIATP